MYDLPSEDPGDPGLPDEFHCFQPQLLRETFLSCEYPDSEVFIGTDINLYFDSRNTLWYKRPDWFVVLGVAASSAQDEMRLSYVIWQESIAPFIVIELLSPGTEDEDLGRTVREIAKPPTKWQVYESILRIPYYILFDRYTNQMRAFALQGSRYQEIALLDAKLWFEEIQLGLGVWQGEYQGVQGQWLRWYDNTFSWLPTISELADQERTRADQERTRAEQEKTRADQMEVELQQERLRSQQLADRLRSLGIDPNDMLGTE